MKGRENNQNKKNDTKWTVVVPEFGIPFLIPPVASAWRRQFISAPNSQLNTHITPVVPDSVSSDIHSFPQSTTVHRTICKPLQRD
jgi:hypothetical protein